MNFKLKRLGLALTFALAGATSLTLSGCGGGGGSSPVVGGSEPLAPITTTDVSTRVVDGPIKNATVCLDKNNNGTCDTGEPTGKTDAAGNVTLKVDNADVGKYPMLAVVSTDATDIDNVSATNPTGSVTTAFTMKAPADKTGVVTPLTTLVQQTVESSGVTSDQAAKGIQDQTGIKVSLFEDFSTNTTADGKAAATVARLVVSTTQQQSQSLTSAIGTRDTSGGTISKADLDKAIRDALMQILPTIVAAANDPAVQTACSGGLSSPACQSAINAQINAVAASTGLTTTTLATVVGVPKIIASTPASTTTVTASPTAGASLRWWSISAPNNWFYRVFVSTAAENTPDASNLVRFRDIRSNNVNGVTATWNFGGSPARNGDQHWNGSAWINCDSAINTSSVRDAQGNSVYNYCDNYGTGSTKRTEVDISGLSLASVINQIKAYPYKDSGPYGTSYATWGPNDTAAGISTTFGTTAFPAGSKQLYQVSTDVSQAYAYDTQTTNQANGTIPAMAAGGGVGAYCQSITSSSPAASSSFVASTLEDLVTSYRGTPCIFGAGSFTNANGTFVSGPRNEGWGSFSISLGIIGAVSTVAQASATAYYSSNTPLRVAFTGLGSAVTYYACQQRSYDGSTRNCNAIGTGNYTITALGDGRVMTFTGVPSQASALNFNRIFVERGSKVYYGYQNKLVTSNQVRLNLTATNAIFSFAASNGVIGLGPITP